MVDAITTIEQLWYTSDMMGAGRTMVGVRAASAGLLQNRGRVQRLDRYLRYELPADTDRHRIEPSMAPVSLALIQIEQGERLLVHKLYTGRDRVGRPGAYFIHLLAGLPTTFSARDAIFLWKASLWKRSDASLPGGSVELPTLGVDALGGTLKHLNFTQVKEALACVIQAYLICAPGQHIYIAAPAEHVAILVAGLTLSLPRQLFAGLTFSTYESDVLSKDQVQLVGTCRIPSSDGVVSKKRELPDACYKQGLVINCYSKEQPHFTAPADIVAFAEYAKDCLVNDDMTALKQLRTRAEKLEDLDITAFLKMWENQQTINKTGSAASQKQSSGKHIEDMKTEPLTAPRPSPHEEEINAILSDPARVGELQERAVRHIIRDLATGKKEWWISSGRPLLLNVREAAEKARRRTILSALADLARSAVADIGLAIANHDKETALRLFDLIVCVAPAPGNPALWTFMLEDLSKSAAALDSWDLRVRMLEECIRIANSINDAQIRPWLMGSWSHFEELLRFHLPDEWYDMLLAVLLTNSPQAPIPQALIEQMQKNQTTLVEKQLLLLLHDPYKASLAVSFFSKLIEGGYSGKMGLLRLLLTVPGVQHMQEIIEDIFKAAQLSSEERVQLLEQNSSALQPYYQVSPTLMTMLEEYLPSIGLDELRQTSTQKFLQSLGDAPSLNLPSDLRELLENWRTLGTYVNQLSVERKALVTLAKHVTQLASWTRTKFMRGLAPLLVEIIECDFDLCSILYALNTVLTQEETRTLLRHIVESAAEKYQTGPVECLIPYIRVALQLTSIYDDLSRNEQEQLKSQLLANILAHGIQTMHTRITSIAKTWEPRMRDTFITYARTGH
jgi:hypothetical protein